MPPLWKQILNIGNTNPISMAGEAVAPLWQKILQQKPTQQPTQSMQPTAQPLWKRILGEPFQGAESIVPLAQKTRALTRQYIDQPFERLTQPVEQAYTQKFNVSPEQMAQIKPKAELANNMIMGLTEPLKFSNIASKLSEADDLNPLLQEARKLGGKEVKMVPVDSLPPRATAIAMSEEEFNATAKSIKKNGIKTPLIIDKKTGRVLDGQRRAFVAKELGMKEVPAVYVDQSRHSYDTVQALNKKMTKEADLNSPTYGKKQTIIRLQYGRRK